MSVPTVDGVLDIVRAAIVIVLEVDRDSVQRDTRLVEDLAADSLALVEIIEIVEERLMPLARPGFFIDDEDFDSIRTVGEAVDHVAARL